MVVVGSNKELQVRCVGRTTLKRHRGKVDPQIAKDSKNRNILTRDRERKITFAGEGIPDRGGRSEPEAARLPLSSRASEESGSERLRVLPRVSLALRLAALAALALDESISSDDCDATDPPDSEPERERPPSSRARAPPGPPEPSCRPLQNIFTFF